MDKLTQKQIDMIDKKFTIKKGIFIVMVNTAGYKDVPVYECNHNIYCVTKDHEIIWQVQVEPTGFERDSFVSVGLDDEGNLRARNFSGFKYLIDLETGKAEMTGWSK